MATIAAGDGFFAQTARFLSEVALSDGESVQLSLAMLAMAASVSVFPGALLGTDSSRDFYPSATLSRLKLVSHTSCRNIGSCRVVSSGYLPLLHKTFLTCISQYGFLCLAAVEIFSLVAWYFLPSYHAAMSPNVAALNFAVSGTTAFVLDVAAKRPYSWLPASAFLVIGIVHDLIKFQVYFRNPVAHFASAIVLAACCCRLNLLLVQLLLPRHVPKSAAESVTRYISWYEELSDILNTTILRGFRNMTDVRSLEKLGPELDPGRLARAFDQNWQKGNQNSQYFLIKVCVQTLSWPAFLGFIPRLFSGGFVFTQAFLLRYILLSDQPYTDVEFRATIVLCTAIIFFGNSISFGLFNFLSHRTQTALRGMLSLQAFRKIDVVDHKRENSSRELQLIERDIDTLCEGVKHIYQYFNDIIRLFSGITLLYMLAGPGCLIAIFAAAIVAVLASVWRRDFASAKSTQAKVSQQYMSELTSSLRQLQLIKMLGLASIMAEKLRRLHVAETKLWRMAKKKIRKITILAMTADACTPICLALYVYKSASGSIAEELLLPTLMISFHVEMALQQGVQRYGSSPRIFEAVNRLQAFLLQKEKVDQRLVEPLGEIAIECVGLAIAPEGCKNPLLEDINVSIAKAKVILAIGPSSSGKSTFLQALAGEADIVGGSIYMDEPAVAYCDQIPWLRNISIRENVVAGLEFENERYHLVLGLCLLDHDLQKLEQGDEYVVGVNGMNLSGGQRHRVVSIPIQTCSISPTRCHVLEDNLLTGL